MKHLQGHPVSASTYCNHGCRCDGCRVAKNAYMRRMRAQPGRTRDRMAAEHYASAQAVKWMRAHEPEMWANWIDQGMARAQQAVS